MAAMDKVANAVDEAAIAANLARIRERIAAAAECALNGAGRRAEEITLVAVSKTFPAEAIRAAYESGVRDFGENRVQEWEGKSAQLGDLQGATWHLIGHLQSNKVRRAARLFDRVDSVDSLSLAQKLDSAAREEGKRLPILLEVKLSGEESKSGIAEAELAATAEGVAALENLHWRGLMTIPPYYPDAEAVRPHFRRLRQLRDELARRTGRVLPVLSMGMSHDFEVAVEEGATEVRIGTAIFGERATGPHQKR
jgi:PLP dependent protein